MKRAAIVVIIGAALLASIVYAVFAYHIELSRNAYTAKNVQRKDYDALYNYYIAGELVLDERPAEGNQSAPLTLTLALDFTSPEQAAWFNETFPQIRTAFVDTGAVKVLEKYSLTEEELDGKKGRFIYAHAAQCYQERQGAVLDFTGTLFATAETDVPSLLTSYGIIEPCGNDEALYQDMIETSQFRLLSPAVYIGIAGTRNLAVAGTPSLAQVTTAVRTRQIEVGI